MTSPTWLQRAAGRAPQQPSWSQQLCDVAQQPSRRIGGRSARAHERVQLAGDGGGAHRAAGRRGPVGVFQAHGRPHRQAGPCAEQPVAQAGERAQAAAEQAPGELGVRRAAGLRVHHIADPEHVFNPAHCAHHR